MQRNNKWIGDYLDLITRKVKVGSLYSRTKSCEFLRMFEIEISDCSSKNTQSYIYISQSHFLTAKYNCNQCRNRIFCGEIKYK